MSKFPISSLLAAALGVGLASTAIAPPANAYGVKKIGQVAGDPSGPLYQVSLDSRYDIQRTLDPFTWFVGAGTSNSSGNVTPVDLSANALLKVINLSANLLSLSITINNTTNPIYQGQLYRAAIMSFGFGVDPNATSAKITYAGNVFDMAIAQTGQQQFPGGFKKIDVCIFAANGCSGGAVTQGLQAGYSDTLQLDISGNFWNQETQSAFVNLTDFPLKFQTDNGSFEPAGIPEPITVLGSAVAFGFAPLFKREMSKKRSKKMS